MYHECLEENDRLRDLTRKPLELGVVTYCVSDFRERRQSFGDYFAAGRKYPSLEEWISAEPDQRSDVELYESEMELFCKYFEMVVAWRGVAGSKSRKSGAVQPTLIHSKDSEDAPEPQEPRKPSLQQKSMRMRGALDYCYPLLIPTAFAGGAVVASVWSLFHSGSAWLGLVLGTTLWLTVSAFALSIVDRPPRVEHDEQR